MIFVDSQRSKPPDATGSTLYRKPPPHFFAEALPPRKIGKSYAYGLRICPLQSMADDHPLEADNASTYSGRSSQSSGSWSGEYIVWRKWADCLRLQDLLEREYSTQAREKRRRLARGKGVKKNGMYMNSDLASSFDSLPFGPDPSSIAKDVHEILPKLTKADSLFRVSQATVDLRHKQFAALIETLFQDDLPTLAIELRNNEDVRDFFGYWESDRDLHRQRARKRRSPSQMSPTDPRSMYFSASVLDLQRPTSPEKDLPPVPEHDTQTMPPHVAHLLPRRPISSYTNRRPELRPPVQPMASRPVPKSAPVVSNRSFGEDSGFAQFSSDDNNDQRRRTPNHNNQSSTAMLLAFPTTPTGEDDLFHITVIPTDLSSNEDSPYQADMTKTPDSSSPRFSLFPTSRRSSWQLSVVDLPSRPSSRLSQSTVSSTLTDQFRDSSVLAHLPWFADESRTPFRNSMASMNSFMTDASVDQILPREVSNTSSPPSRPLRQSLSLDSLSISEQDKFLHEEELCSDLAGHFLDSDLRLTEDSASVYRQSRVKAHHSEYISQPYLDQCPDLPSTRIPHLQSPTAPLKCRGVAGEALTVKVFLTEDTIASFRLPVEVSYDDVRQRILEGLVREGGMQASKPFSVAYLVPDPVRVSPSTSDSGPDHVLRYIQSDKEWQEAVKHCGGRLALRVFESI